MWKLNNTLLNNQWIQQYIRRIKIMTKWDLSQECKFDLTSKNQLI